MADYDHDKAMVPFPKLLARIAEVAATYLPVAPTPGSPMWKRQQAMFEAIAA